MAHNYADRVNFPPADLRDFFFPLALPALPVGSAATSWAHATLTGGDFSASTPSAIAAATTRSRSACAASIGISVVRFVKYITNLMASRTNLTCKM